MKDQKNPRQTMLECVTLRPTGPTWKGKRRRGIGRTTRPLSGSQYGRQPNGMVITESTRKRWAEEREAPRPRPPRKLSNCRKGRWDTRNSRKRRRDALRAAQVTP